MSELQQVDPWLPNIQQSNTEKCDRFEDEFMKVYVPLEDTQLYLASLENRLSKIKNRKNLKTDVLNSFHSTCEFYMSRLVSNDRSELNLNQNPELEEELKVSEAQRWAKPKQALVVGELEHLIESDYTGFVSSGKNKMEKPKEFWGRDTFLVVTGASRGIGRNVAIEFGRRLGPCSVLLLMARSMSMLEETKKLIGDVNANVHIQLRAIDLNKPNCEEFETILKEALSIGGKPHDFYLIVHNAASIVCDIPAAEMNNISVWNEYMTLNLYSVAMLTSTFLKLVRNECEKCFVNITSIVAVKPIKGLTLYAVGKASREMYFRMLAEENPSLNILNYSPGPVDTEMYSHIEENCCDAEVKTYFQESKRNDKIVKMEETIAKLMRVLEQRSYNNGDRVDFYDR